MNFPILCLKEKDNMVYYFESVKSLEYTSDELFKAGVFKGVKYIDAIGMKYHILETQKIGYVGLWGWNPLLKGRQIKVRHKFSESEKVNIDNLKDELITKVKKHRQYWSESWDINELVMKIYEANSFIEVIKLFK